MPWVLDYMNCTVQFPDSWIEYIALWPRENFLQLKVESAVLTED